MSEKIGPYCNWGLGFHGKRCQTPMQCFCLCHRPQIIKQKIEYHEEALKQLRTLN